LRQWIEGLNPNEGVQKGLVSLPSILCGPCLLRCLNVWPITADKKYIDDPNNPQWYSDAVIGKLGEENYDCDTQVLSIKTPVSTIVRQASMLLYLKMAFSGFPGLSESPIEIKDVIKNLINKQLSEKTKFKPYPESPLSIFVTFKHDSSANEHLFLSTMQGTPLKLRTVRQKRMRVTIGDSRESIVKAIESITPDENYPCPPTSPKDGDIAEIESIETKHSSIYIGGRYVKLERNISQTPFIVDGRRICELSISECIGEPLKRLTLADNYNFVGAGREDADVRMLGDGRPFYVEIMNPRSPHPAPEDLSAVEKELSEKGSDTKIIKEGEQEKRKCYSALVWLANPLSTEKLAELNMKYATQKFVIQQKTPIRVLHRPKTIYSMKITPLSGHFYQVELDTEAGTYIKEFIHGDMNRTRPNFGEMCESVADILELDVER
ncbi:hypothetical protein EV182_002512, partial [Spiromyces aspiralis]